MGRVIGVLILMCFLSCALGQDVTITAQASRAMPKPELPYYDWNACPGEGCIYGHWIARHDLKVFNSCRLKRRQIAQLRAGDKITAVTGVVITSKPGVIRMDRDLPSAELRRGDEILTFADQGEGNSAVWIKGRYFPTFDISFTTWPDGAGCVGGSCGATYLDLGQKAWWAKVRLPSGNVGWIDVDHADLDGVCSAR